MKSTTCLYRKSPLRKRDVEHVKIGPPKRLRKIIRLIIIFTECLMVIYSISIHFQRLNKSKNTLNENSCQMQILSFCITTLAIQKTLGNSNCQGFRATLPFIILGHLHPPLLLSVLVC